MNRPSVAVEYQFDVFNFKLLKGLEFNLEFISKTLRTLIYNQLNPKMVVEITSRAGGERWCILKGRLSKVTSATLSVKDIPVASQV